MLAMLLQKKKKKPIKNPGYTNEEMNTIQIAFLLKVRNCAVFIVSVSLNYVN